MYENHIDLFSSPEHKVYDSYVRNTTISFSVRWHYVLFQDGMAFQVFLSRFKILRGHLDQTRPNSSNNVRKQICCYYDHSVFTPFKPVRFELLGRNEDENKCNGGIRSNTLPLREYVGRAE